MYSAPHIVLALAQFVAALLAGLGLLALVGLDARMILMSNLAASLFVLAGFTVAVLAGRASFSPRLWRVLPSFGLLLVPVAFTGWAADHAEPLRSWPNVRAVLACSIPYGILLALQSSALLPAVPPTASECPPSPSERARVFTYLVLAFVSLFLLVALVARAALAPLEEAFHSNAGLLIPFLAAAYALSGIQLILAPSVQFSQRAALLPLVGGAAAVLNLLLNLALVPLFGPLGAAAATLAAFLVLAGATYHLAQSSFPTPFERARILKILASATIIYLATLRWPVDGSAAWLCAHVVMALIGFPIVLGLAGFFRPADRAVLRRFLPAA